MVPGAAFLTAPDGVRPGHLVVTATLAERTTAKNATRPPAMLAWLDPMRVNH